MLAALLEAWYVVPHDALVPLIELVGKRVARVPTLPRTFQAQQAAWLEIAAAHDPRDLEWLIGSLFCPHGAPTRERIAALSRWPQDPRFARLLLSACVGRHLTSEKNRPVWTAVLRLLRTRAGRRDIPHVRQLATISGTSVFDQYLRRQLGRLADQLSRERFGAPRPLARSTADLLASIGAKLDAARVHTAERTADELLAEVWRAPEDDGPRAVLADWLIERGDPRGELVSLQLARHRGRGTVASQRRERKLLRDHARTWMGPLEPVVSTSAFVFERGFLAACKVRWRVLAGVPELMTHPAWATVRSYVIAPDGERACGAWLDHMIALGAKRA
jgi:uncharacterized protein (TIGR02996 family)